MKQKQSVASGRVCIPCSNTIFAALDLYQMVIITFLIAFTGFLIKNLDAMETRKHYIQAIGSHTFGRRALKRQKTIVPHTFHPPTPFFSCCEKYDAVTIKNQRGTRGIVYSLLGEEYDYCSYGFIFQNTALYIFQKMSNFITCLDNTLLVT